MNLLIVTHFLLLLVLVCSTGYDSVFASTDDGEVIVRCVTRESKALLKFKEGLVDEHSMMSSCMGKENECCKWEGVECSNTTGLVIALQLAGHYLGGEINSALLELHSLKVFDLSENDFGNIEFPEFICSMSNLQHLNLSWSNFSARTLPSQLWSNHTNKFNGNLPSQIGNLTNLRSLDLSGNGFSGIVPSEIGNLTNLVTLDLSSNQFSGTISPHIRQLSTLEELDVSFNYMEATITEADLTNLPNLKLLGLSFNLFTLDISPDWTPPFQLSVIGLSRCNLGPHFPSWIRRQTDFTWLDLSLNNISGEIPPWLSSFSQNVFYLNISHNQLSGTISEFSTIDIIDVSSNKFSGPMPLFSPSTVIFQISRNMFSGSFSFNCSSPYALLILDLSNNELSRKLPNCWGNWDALRILILSNNSFSGEIPRDLGSLSKLKKLHLANNNLSGELPSTLQNCKSLQLIDFGDNMLTGSIPTWIGEYHETIAKLTLCNNRFRGSIPPQICYLSHIQLLDLSGNNLSGKIPQCFNNFTFMVDSTNVSRDYNIPPVFSLSDHVAVFNEYTIVSWKRNFAEFGRKNLMFLKLIDLSRNRLVGSIPRSFSSLKALRSLNLSGNRLTGIIDPYIGQMSSLDSLDLSSNHLSGPIPVSIEKLNFVSFLDLANNNLSGEIPTGGMLPIFPASVYAGNIGLCGSPLRPCSVDRPDTSTNREAQNVDDDGGILSLSFLTEIGIPIILGFIVGFWGVVGSLVVNESWRRAFYNCWSAVGDWFYVWANIYRAKLTRS